MIQRQGLKGEDVFMSKKKIVAACYCRVSTKSGPQASSLDNQQSFFEDYVRDNPEYKLYKIYPDKGISGTLLHRKHFDEMLKDAGLDIKEVSTVSSDELNTDDTESNDKKSKTTTTYKKYVFIGSNRTPKFTEILVRNTSRFARNILIADILNELKRKGVTVRFLDINRSTANPDDISFIQMFQNFDEMFSRDLSRKVKAGNERSIARRIVRSTPRLYGYNYIKRETLQDNNKLKRRDGEVDTVRSIYRLYAGCMSIYDDTLPDCDYKCDTCTIERSAGVGERVISKYLKEHNIYTRNKKEFGITTLGNMLKNEKYYGYLNTGKFDAGELFSNTKSVKVRDSYLLEPHTNIESIVSKELFDLCQERRSSRYDTIKAKGLPSTSSPFGGLLVCSKCGSKYLHNSDRGRGFYQCGNKKRKGVKVCDAVNVSDNIVNNYIEELTTGGALSVALYQNRQERVIDVWVNISNKIVFIESNRDPKKLAQLQADRDRLENRLIKQYDQLDYEDKEGQDSAILQRLILKTKEDLFGIQKQLDKYTKRPKTYLEESKILLEYAYEIIDELDTRARNLTKQAYTVDEVRSMLECIIVCGESRPSEGIISSGYFKPVLKMSEKVKNILYNNEAIFSEDADKEVNLEELEKVKLFPPSGLKEMMSDLSAKLEVLETQYF